jgi:hypothetical protein
VTATYRLLLRIARMVLSLQTTSAASESAFSHAKSILTDQRQSLHPHSVNMLTTVQCNLPDSMENSSSWADNFVRATQMEETKDGELKMNTASFQAILEKLAID